MSPSTTPLDDRIALITGANSGLGKAVSTELARRGATVVMVARSRERGLAAQREIRDRTDGAAVHLLLADLASQADIRRLASEFRSRFDRLDLLINNAGSAFPERRLSPDDIEMTLAVNHLAPFLLTNLLLNRLEAGAPARIVNVGTRIETAMDLDDLQWERRRYRMMGAYGQSKLGNIHFTRELARRLAGTDVTVNCVFPGVFASNLGKTDGAQGWFWRLIGIGLGWAIPTPESAAQRVLFMATSPEIASITGRYVAEEGRPIQAPPQARDPMINRQVWDISARLCRLDRVGEPR